jgi:hypothetical protein
MVLGKTEHVFLVYYAIQATLQLLWCVVIGDQRIIVAAFIKFRK